MGLFINRFWPQNPRLLQAQEVLAGPESVPHPANNQTNSLSVNTALFLLDRHARNTISLCVWFNIIKPQHLHNDRNIHIKQMLLLGFERKGVIATGKDTVLWK